MKTSLKALNKKRAENYKALRQILGTQEAAASILGITSRTIMRRESGDDEISKEAEFAMQWATQWKRDSDKMSVDKPKQKP